MCRSGYDGVRQASRTQHSPHFAGRQVVARQMHSVCSGRSRYIRTRIDQQFRGTTALRLDHFDGRPRQFFQFADAEVLLAQLDVVHSGGSRFAYLRQQALATFGFSAGESRPVSDVVQQHGMILNVVTIDR
jgi:hypothetical protein